MRKDSKAEALEEAGLYYRAARRWLEVFDLCEDEQGRNYAIEQRERCLTLAGNPAEAKARRKREYKARHRL
ncbi:PerC family transcriptional regulator [Morganella morganii]|uniref:PerC family transcriptional regulator n=1 Tax=Morganella morganii TaxID=582 RepID=UPI0004685072|nr:PerC family transcriptional regulator [Morganella morganii]HAT1525734.1 PerC family transcriptional regulator [Morganella morganii]HDU8581255.1 PerC family transcriptional regulator [Morganella morganii]